MRLWFQWENKLKSTVSQTLTLINFNDYAISENIWIDPITNKNKNERHVIRRDKRMTYNSFEIWY